MSALENTMLHKIKWLHALLSIAIPVAGLAATPSANQTKPQTPTNPTQKYFHTQCPKPSQLRQNLKNMTWYVQSTIKTSHLTQQTKKTAPGWKSYDYSMAKKVTEFVGAQWLGAKLGQIICIYRSPEPGTFAIKLISNKMSKSPTEGKWSRNLGGYKNCKGTGIIISDCPFAYKITTPEKNIYQQVKQLKADDSHTD